MDLELKAADDNYLRFAWSLFGDFIRQNMFSGASGRHSPNDWNEEAEFHKFSDYWKANDQHIITVDGKPIGWASIHKLPKKVVIDNWQLVPEWRNRGVTKIILGDLVPKGKAAGLEVETSILQQANLTSVAERLVTKLGFSPDRVEEHSKIMRAV